ncbi:hypothetical protein FM103_08215 [Corynebacterium xerosis]|nr:hypothetical protein FM103_08215 [Corynebacterium xerosis]
MTHACSTTSARTRPARFTGATCASSVGSHRPSAPGTAPTGISWCAF